MIKLKTSLIWPGCAQGRYSISKARGYILAILRWGNHKEPAQDWSPIAYIPIDPAGNGEFFFPNRRAIPAEVTHLWAHLFSHDFTSFEEVSIKIPARYLPEITDQGSATHFSILTDLHLASKPWMVRRALKAAEGDIILLLGDSTNDGLSEQFNQFQGCIAETVSNKSVFCVPGNHDVTHLKKIDDADDGLANYAFFQRNLLAMHGNHNLNVEFDENSLAYTVEVDDLDLIALQCVGSGRQFRFPEGRQLDWLERHLEERIDAQWHIMLCHAPLLAHNPKRNSGTPYLDKNKRLQEIVDRYGKIIFLSGHTHMSPNGLKGNGQYDGKHQNIYLDCGSVVPTDTTDGEVELMAPDWKDGVKTELSVSGNTVEICMQSISSGMKFSRGYYRFLKEPGIHELNRI